MANRLLQLKHYRRNRRIILSHLRQGRQVVEIAKELDLPMSAVYKVARGELLQKWIKMGIAPITITKRFTWSEEDITLALIDCMLD